MKDRFKQWYSALQPRERLLVGVAATVVILTFMFLTIWEPLHGSTKRLRDEVVETRSLVTQLAQAQAEISASRGGMTGGMQGKERSLLSIVDQTSKQAGLTAAVKRMQPDGEATVRVWLELADFASVVRWLGTLEFNYGANVSDADINRDTQSGTVRARIDLVRATQ